MASVFLRYIKWWNRRRIRRINCEDARYSKDKRSPQREIIEIIKRTINNKRSGSKAIWTENLKYGGSTGYISWFKEFGRQMRKDWKRATIIPLVKSVDKVSCHNFRGIGCEVSSYSNVHYESIGTAHRATSNIYCEVLRTCYKCKIPVMVLFLGFRKSYNSVKRTKLIETR